MSHLLSSSKKISYQAHMLDQMRLKTKMRTGGVQTQPRRGTSTQYSGEIVYQSSLLYQKYRSRRLGQRHLDTHIRTDRSMTHNITNFKRNLNKYNSIYVLKNFVFFLVIQGRPLADLLLFLFRNQATLLFLFVLLASNLV